MNPEIFIELSKVLAIAIVVTGLTRLIKQPAIIGYILTGIIAGPVVLNIISSTDTFTAFSQIGVALLLFFVGLNLNPKVIKEVGKVALFTGLGQIILTTSIGFGIGKLIGLSTTHAAYIGIALAFSSTIVIMKLLSDKNELESLYGRISVGFLIVQDFIAIFVLLIISSISQGTNIAQMALETLLKGIGGIVVLVLLTLYVLPKITKYIAKSQEFLLLFSISWCFIVAAAFHFLNFSIEAGALIAGIMLSMSPYHFEISAKLKPLRDFFLVLFFIMLGSQMIFGNLIQHIPLILGLSALVLIGNPIIVMSIMGLLGHKKRTSFQAGLAVAQISEFSLIVISLGVSVGHLTQEILSIVTVIALITFTGSTYLILYSNKIYNSIQKYLSVFERKNSKKTKKGQKQSPEIVLFGYNRIGIDILEALKKMKNKVLIVDFDPQTISAVSKEHLHFTYGDANDVELLNSFNFKKTKMVISTIPTLQTNSLLISKVLEQNKKCIIAVVSYHLEEAQELYRQGATYVIMPHFLGGKHFATMLEKNKTSMSEFLKEKIVHLEDLKNRKRKGYPLHPIK